MIDPSPLAADAASASRLVGRERGDGPPPAMIGQTSDIFASSPASVPEAWASSIARTTKSCSATIAIKVVGRRVRSAGLDRLRIVEEARAASGLSHPHICTVYETGDINGQAYIAMEYVEGRPLSEMIPPGGLPIEAVIRYGIQIADALAHAHRRGVIHRDLKTSNVVVTRMAARRCSISVSRAGSP